MFAAPGAASDRTDWHPKDDTGQIVRDRQPFADGEGTSARGGVGVDSTADLAAPSPQAGRLGPMKSILKIALGLLVVTMAVQGGRAAMKHYTFVDAIHEAMVFGSGGNEAELADRVMELAADYEIPLDPERLTVTRAPFNIQVDAPYTDTVNLIPGVYSRTWDYHAGVSVRLLEDTRRRSSPTGRRR